MKDFQNPHCHQFSMAIKQQKHWAVQKLAKEKYWEFGKLQNIIGRLGGHGAKETIEGIGW